MRYLAVVGLVFALAGCDIAPGEANSAGDNATLQLYAMNCGHLASDDLAPFGSEGEYDGQPGELAVMCFLIRHPKGDLVWDAGLPDAINANPEGEAIEGGVMKVPVTMASQLEAIGVTTAEIEYFSVSHSHFDHVGNAGLFSESTLLIQQAEVDFMSGLGDEMGLVTPELVEPMRSMETITFTDDYDVFGDGSVVIVPTPGHTPGHAVLFIDLENAGPLYLSGDLYHIARSRTERIVPEFNVSKPQTLETMEIFEARVAAEGARVIIQHSMEEQAQLPDIPGFLD